MWQKLLCPHGIVRFGMAFRQSFNVLSSFPKTTSFFSEKKHLFIFSSQAIDLTKTMKGDNTKITMDDVKEYSKSVQDYKSLDSMHILHSILLRDLPQERFGAIINLILATRPSASTEEIEDSLVCSQVFITSNFRIFQTIFHVKNSTCRVYFRDICTVLDHMTIFPTSHRCVGYIFKQTFQ